MDYDIQLVLSRLPHLTNEELCEIGEKINEWNWDDRLGEEPKDFYDLPCFNHRLVHVVLHRKTRDTYITPIFKAIEALVPERERFKFAIKKHSAGISDDEFEILWRKLSIQRATGYLL